MGTPLHPSLYQINTRVWLTMLAQSLRRPATLDDILDAELDRLATRGFDWIWLLSVWQTGLAGQRVSRVNPEWWYEFQETQPDLCDDDIAGCGFVGAACVDRDRHDLDARGLYLDMPSWSYHVFDISAIDALPTDRQRLAELSSDRRAAV